MINYGSVCSYLDVHLLFALLAHFSSKIENTQQESFRENVRPSVCHVITLFLHATHLLFPLNFFHRT